jgi:OOP family OmpA-OmpF porin
VAAAPPSPPPPPPDSDGDGVLDAADQCPNTGAGIAVDLVGCPRQGSIVLEGIAFEVASDHLTADSQTTLDRLAADLKKYPQLRIELQGHTDSSGSDAFNLQLSQHRAEAVRDFMVKAGVPAGQLVAKGYGESQPATSNATVEGRAKNRRVVMFVVANPGSVKVEGAGAGAAP